MRPSSLLKTRNDMPHLNTDLDRLPVSALGVRDALSVILGMINHRGLVSGLLLQREDDASDVHVAAMNRNMKLRWLAEG